MGVWIRPQLHRILRQNLVIRLANQDGIRVARSRILDRASFPDRWWRKTGTRTDRPRHPVHSVSFTRSINCRASCGYAACDFKAV